MSGAENERGVGESEETLTRDEFEDALTGAAGSSLAPEMKGQVSSDAGSRSDHGDSSSFPKIDGYWIEGLLGHGGMAEVHKAQRMGSAGVPVPCVIKTILSDKVDHPQFQKKFLDEARIHAKMQHPNLVQVLDVGRIDGRLFLVMEWIDGMDAADLLRAAQARRIEVPVRHVLFILKQVLQALHHTHTHGGHGFVHRDISPGNILISRQGAVKLADFGVARSADSLSRDPARSLAGKLHYFAPELVTGEAPASVQSDIFALGVTFWELLTCRPLFSREKKWKDLRAEIRDFDPRDLLEKELTLPEPIEEIVLRCLANRPRDRYKSALEFLEDVNDFAYEAGLRLLDAHFADYVRRTLDYRESGGGKTLRQRLAEEKSTFGGGA